jgi:hypothetical protein
VRCGHRLRHSGARRALPQCGAQGPLTSVTSTRFSTSPTPSISVMRWDAARFHSSHAFRGRLRQVTAPRLRARSGGGHVRPNRQIAHRSAIVVCSGCGGRRPHGLSLPSRVAGGENTA